MNKIYVGLSGGVDSATSAALLKEQGYDVTGVFIKIWSPEFLECTWRDDRLDAMRVAVHLGIPFKEIDLSEEYRTEIVADMVEAYQKGITPNPDVLCNKVIKFGAFARWAFDSGAEAIATGHYARIVERNGKYQLLRGKDSLKDQSYFVYELPPAMLSKVLFPIGGMLKSEVRETARRFKLPVSEKPDSQGLCFVGDVSLGDFLSRFIPLQPGDVLDSSGKNIGEHDGAALYTLGQRHGFRVRNGGEGPHYVTLVDAKKNTIIVSKKKNDAESLTASVAAIRWHMTPPVHSFEAGAQCRYREPVIRALFEPTESGLQTTFASPHIAAKGQSLVMYEGDIVLAGGIIQ